MAAWSNGNVSTCGVMGREIDSRQGIGWQILKSKAKNYLYTYESDAVVSYAI
jgi:hypothetical protein